MGPLPLSPSPLWIENKLVMIVVLEVMEVSGRVTEFFQKGPDSVLDGGTLKFEVIE